MSDVLLVCGSFWPREGGAERQLRTLLSEFDREGVSCVVVTQVLPHRPTTELLPGTKVIVRRAGSRFAFSRFPRIAQLIFTLHALLWVLASRPSSVVSMQFGSATIAGALAARILQAQHVIRLTGGGTKSFRSESVARAASPLGRRLVNFACRGNRKLVVAPARHLLTDFRQEFPSVDVPVVHVPNGVEPIEAGAASDRTGVLWYARAGSERSVPAFEAIALAAPSHSFAVIGADIQCEARNVQVYGWIEDPSALIASVRCLLNTSQHEGSPNMALQAISAGCFVLGKPNAGILELRDDFPKHVRVVDTDDPAEVARVLDSLRKSELPGPGRVITSEAALTIWKQLLKGSYQ